MPTRTQKSISAATYQLALTDSGTTHRLTGSQSQAITGPPATGPGAVPSGTFYPLVNQSGFDATFSPVSGHTVEGQASRTITAGEAVTIELCGSDWVVVAAGTS